MLRNLAFAAFLIAAALVASPSFAVTPSYYLSADTAFVPADLACNCQILIAVADGADIFIDLPASLSMSKWNPSISITTNNGTGSAFTVRADGLTILNHFTTRGAVAHIAPSQSWRRIQ